MDILADARHRQWPLPDDPWIVKQAWNDLLFAHWPIARDRLRERLPSFLEIDLFDDEAWLSVTPFKLSDFSPRGIPAMPLISSFDEINVRTYVVYEGIPGIYFFSLDANSALAVGGASTLFHLPYFLADIHMECDRGRFSFRSRRRHGAEAEFDAHYSGEGSLFEPVRGTLDYFLTERYCLYTHDSAGNAYRVEIHHAPWQLQNASADVVVNTMADAAGVRLPSMAPVLHYARRQDVVTWSPHRLR
jgi:uncharacterized protein YqjF (DUF2071 family)